MTKKNTALNQLQANYLFAEIAKRKEKFPNAINLGIGDTTLPIPLPIIQALKQAAQNLGNQALYTGYEPYQGRQLLRTKIATQLYTDVVSSEEIFVSDGSKCDIGRLQLLFNRETKIAVQDPVYPVYVDTNVIMGRTGPATEGHYQNITYLPCRPENDFFPDLTPAWECHLIYLCNPNNPTGTAATREQLTQLVQFAKQNQSIIIYDAAYSSFIRDPNLPQTIYEIDGARDVAIETNSFSKSIGFTGLRLGWTIVPKELQFDDGSSVLEAWQRISSTFFNGPSNIAQLGGIAAMTPEGLEAAKGLTNHYLENIRMLRELFISKKIRCYGGTNSPYLWVHFPGQKSWDLFDHLLEKGGVVTTPGSGFGPAGEGFVRFSGFANRQDVEKAVERLSALL